MRIFSNRVFWIILAVTSLLAMLVIPSVLLALRIEDIGAEAALGGPSDPIVRLFSLFLAMFLFAAFKAWLLEPALGGKTEQNPGMARQLRDIFVIVLVAVFGMAVFTLSIADVTNPFTSIAPPPPYTDGNLPERLLWFLQLLMFALDQTLKGAVFDVFDVLDLPLSNLEVRPDAFWFLGIIIAYRLFVAGAIARFALSLFGFELVRRARD